MYNGRNLNWISFSCEAASIYITLRPSFLLLQAATRLFTTLHSLIHQPFIQLEEMALTSFELFPRLPLEIQQEIWEASFNEPSLYMAKLNVDLSMVPLYVEHGYPRGFHRPGDFRLTMFPSGRGDQSNSRFEINFNSSANIHQRNLMQVDRLSRKFLISLLRRESQFCIRADSRLSTQNPSEARDTDDLDRERIPFGMGHSAAVTLPKSQEILDCWKTTTAVQTAPAERNPSNSIAFSLEDDALCLTDLSLTVQAIGSLDKLRMLHRDQGDHVVPRYPSCCMRYTLGNLFPELRQLRILAFEYQQVKWGEDGEGPNPVYLLPLLWPYHLPRLEQVHVFTTHIWPRMLPNWVFRGNQYVFERHGKSYRGNKCAFIELQEGYPNSTLPECKLVEWLNHEFKRDFWLFPSGLSGPVRSSLLARVPDKTSEDDGPSDDARFY
jgi:hypothetical protein